MTAVAIVVLAVGIAVTLLALLWRSRERAAIRLRRLDVQHDLGPDEVAAITAAAGTSDRRSTDEPRLHGVAGKLERAAIPVRPAEYRISVFAVGVLIGVWLWIVSGIVALLLAGLVGAQLGGAVWIDVRAKRRRRRFEEQLPDLLTSLAASMRGGHTLLRAAALYAHEVAEPMRSELERVVADTRLGVPVVDAFGRLADRVRLEELSWVVEAIRIQQTVGGRLAELLFTLSSHLRGRVEIRREVQVLTAEGRLSAWVLALLPVGLGLFIAVRSPDYIAPLLSGAGLAMLSLAAVGVVLGGLMIHRMVQRIDA